MTRKKINKMAKEYGFFLVRSKKHKVWRNASGVTIVTGSSPSDRNAERNIEKAFSLSAIKAHE